MSDEFSGPTIDQDKGQTGGQTHNPIPHPPASPPVGMVRQFYLDLMGCLTEPRRFFTERYPQMTFVYSLTFAVVVNWIADIISWLTRVVRHETLLDGLLKMKDRLQDLPVWKELPSSIWAQPTPVQTQFFPAWLAEALTVALSPFNSLFRLCIGGLVIWLGVYFLVPKTQPGFEPAIAPVGPRDSLEVKNVIKIVAITSAPNLVAAILGFLPLSLGTFFAGIYALVLLILAITIRYRVSGLRAFAIILFPGIILTVVVTCLIGTFGALIFGMFAALFSLR